MSFIPLKNEDMHSSPSDFQYFDESELKGRKVDESPNGNREASHEAKTPVALDLERRSRVDSFADDSDNFRTIPTASRGIISCYYSERPHHVLIVKRPHTPAVTGVFKKLTEYLIDCLGLNVLVEPSLVEEVCATKQHVKLKTWNPSSKAQDFANLIDFVITLGGDGTVLWASNLFPTNVPPVLGVYMGSLGYLSQFTTNDIEEIIDIVLEKKFFVCLRRRLHVKVVDQYDKVLSEFSALNECVVDRGPSCFLTSLDVFYNDQFFTHVTADGIILATPTGSTAYSMSAGGSVVHPKVPCILFTPTCPHSLSFRPVILPDTASIRVTVPADVNFSAWLSVDGRACHELKRRMSVIVSLSIYPLPMIMKGNDGSPDYWLTSLQGVLNWNQRIRQQHIEYYRSSSELEAPEIEDRSPEVPVINSIPDKKFCLGENMLIPADDLSSRHAEGETVNGEATGNYSEEVLSLLRQPPEDVEFQHSPGETLLEEDTETSSLVSDKNIAKKRDSFTFKFGPDKGTKPVDLLRGTLDNTKELVDITSLPRNASFPSRKKF